MDREQRCRECDISHIEPGAEIEGQPLAWADDDLCSRCQDAIEADLVRDAARYRHLRDRPTAKADIGVGGVFAGQIPQNLILGGEDLDRAVDTAMGADPTIGETLEVRLAACLAEAIDTPILTVKEHGVDRDFPLRLGAFLPDISERAAELLEEAGL